MFKPGLLTCLIVAGLVAGSANRASAAQNCAFFDDFQRAGSNTLGNGWEETEFFDPEILLTSIGPDGFVDVVATGNDPARMTQFLIDTSSLTNPAIAFLWRPRNGSAEFVDVMQVDWRTSGGVWNQLAEFTLFVGSNGEIPTTRFEELSLPAAAINTNIDIRFTIIADEFQEGVNLDDIGVCEFVGPPDCNTNGIIDADEIAAGTSPDLNNNGIPDDCDECVVDGDCSDGLFCTGREECRIDVCEDQPDPCGAGQTCDEGNDQCLPDCNANGIDDAADITSGFSDDLNANTIPDECDECVNNGDCDDSLFCTGVETCDGDTCVAGTDPCAIDEFCDEATNACVANVDCNTNGNPDPLDITGGTSNDINTNNVPDECDECLNDNDCADTLFCNGVETCDVDTCVAGTDPCLTGQTCDEAADSCPATGADCNTNGIGDATDIAMGTSADLNTNSIPDECDDCFNDAGCDDGDFCNGAETCDTDTCQPGANPCLLGEVCDEPTDVCSQPDCNTNSIGDLDDIAAGTSDDTNTNGIPDECEGCTTDTECDDGLFCNGTEVCINSVCESPGGACQPGQSCNEDTDTCNAAGGGGGGGGPPPDGDGDGVSDGADDCPNTPTGESVDADGCSQSQLDDDEDGVVNDVDQCADTPAAEIADVDTNGCAPSQLDDDVVIEPDPQPGPDDANTNGDDGTNPGDDTNTNGENPDIGDNGMDDNGMVDEPDSDGDGVPDRTDECALTPAGFEVNSVGCALIEPDPTDAQDGCANGIGCGAGGLATLTMMMLGFGGLKVNRRRIRRTHR